MIPNTIRIRHKGLPDHAIEVASASTIHAATERRGGRWFRLSLRFVMRVYDWSLRLLLKHGRKPRPLPPHGYEILLTGTFFSDNWVRAHLLPLAASEHCARLRMVATARVPDIPNVEGVYPPRWLVRATGTVPARLLYFVWTALRTRPHVVGGFHLLVNGLLSTLSARLVGAHSLYFCVGGPVELLDGGVHGENRIFARLGEPDALVERKLLNAVGACDLVITMGTGAIEFFKGRGLATRFEVISGGIDHTRFFSTDEARDFDVILTCRLVPIKRVDLFLRTVAHLVRDLPNLRAAIVGDGPLRANMEALARELGVERHVTFAGQQSDVEVWLRRSRIFVLTSDSEGLSLSLMEAMMCGLPAVVSQVGDLGELVSDGVNGYLVTARDAEAFARPLRQLLTDTSMLHRFSEAAARAGSANRPATVTRRWNSVLNGLDNQLARASGKGAPGAALSRKNAWEWLPARLKSPIGTALSAAPPAFLFGRTFQRTMQLIEDAQIWSITTNREYQLAQVRQLCMHASQRSRYYREAFRSVNFDPRDLTHLDQLQALPTIDRHTLRDHLAEMRAVSKLSPSVDLVSTGGSSGTPLSFYINSHRSPIEYAYVLSSWRRAGFQLGTTLAVLRGRQVEPDAAGLRHEYDPLFRSHYYSGYHLDAPTIHRYVEHIRGIGPCYLHGYPSSIAAVVRYLKSSGVPRLTNVLGVLAESEVVTEEHREATQDIFQSRYFASYGLTEKVVAAAGCEHSDDYHVFPTYGFFELLDESGGSVTTPGKRGEIVGTGFINTATPFIRYRTGDFATYVSPSCDACGRLHDVIRDIQPRRPQEFLVTDDGSLISWTALNMHDDTFHNVARFQFVQVTRGRATLQILPLREFSASDSERIQRNLQAKLQGRILINVEVVASIPFSVAGKAVYIDQKLPIHVSC